MRTILPVPGRATIGDRAARLPSSRIRDVMRLSASRPDAIHLEVGEPDVTTAAHVVEAAARAAREGHTGYAPSAGIDELREALAAKVAARNGYVPRVGEIVVTTGGMGAVLSSFAALLDPGDEVLIPDPGWPNFALAARLLGVDPVPYELRADDGFRPSLDVLAARVTERTRALVLNSPSNPLGAVVPPAEVAAISDFARAHGLWLVSDECYDEIVFDGVATSPAATGERDHVVCAYSCSKTYAMTGWRIGYAVAPEPVAAVIAKLQEPLVACANTFAQFGAVAAITGPQDAVRRQVAHYARRARAATEVLEGADLPALTPSGAFYLWIDVRRAGRTSDEFARSLLEEHDVAVVPGTAFGASGEGFVRVSLATAEPLLLEGVRRLARHATASRAAA